MRSSHNLIKLALAAVVVAAVSTLVLPRLSDIHLPGAALTIASGMAWAASAALAGRRRQLSARLNFLAAVLGALSGIELLF